jgi:hypothetical protein
MPRGMVHVLSAFVNQFVCFTSSVGALYERPRAVIAYDCALSRLRFADRPYSRRMRFRRDSPDV